MRFSSLLCLASLVISSFAAATLPDVESHVAAISSQVATIDTLIRQYAKSGASIAQGLALRNKGLTLIKTLNDAAADIKCDSLKTEGRISDSTLSAPVSEANGRLILDDLKKIEPIISASHAFVVANKIMTTPGIRALFKSHLTNLHTSTTAFANTLMACAPENLKAEGMAVKNRIDDAFAKTFAAFA
ncbi:hypothetical protein FPV67DRAFT_182139 [Lyophyllum atratum]|nr:hypothetical protein FPV67DRAFT_182139 [Lyophyllum atratum]